MGKKMSLMPFLFKPTDPPSSSNSNNSTWPWGAACGSPKTLSFRADKIMNSVYITESRFTDPSESDLADSIGVVELVEDDGGSGGPQSIENVIRGLKSDRLFFEAGDSSSCMLMKNNSNNKAKPNGHHKYSPANAKDDDDDGNGEGNTRVMEMESNDPFADFKKSMEEMVEAHGLKDNWEGLQQLLGLYLKVNGKSNHGYVVGAFVDLLVALHFTNSSTTTTTTCSSVASSSRCDGGGDDGVGDIDSSSATALTDQSPVSGLSFSSNYSSTSNSTSTPYYCLSSLEEESATPANDEDDGVSTIT